MIKKMLPVLLSLVVLAVSMVPAVNVSAYQAMYYPNELAYYDAQIDVMTPRLELFQSQYYNVNGRYYQALTSHTSAPDVPTVPDAIEEHPTDQPEDLALFWDAFAELPSQLAWSFRIDTYTAPDGDGYVLSVETNVDGDTWRRSTNYGPASEDWRSTQWYKVMPFEY